MFSKLAIISSLAILAVATPTPNDTPPQTCTTGPIQCCQSTTTAGAPAAAAILGLLGVVVQDLNVLLGLDCSPISVVGVGSGSACSAQTVCCENNSFVSCDPDACTAIG